MRNPANQKYHSFDPERKYGRLEPVEYVGKRLNSVKLWLCRCECGNTSIVQQCNLLSGTTRSCGCLNLQVRRSTGKLRLGRSA